MFRNFNRFFFQRLFGVLLVIFIAISSPPSFPYHLEYLMVGLGIVLLLCGLMGRMYATLYIGEQKSSRLVCEGPYTLCRNPLYFFSFIAFLGVLCLNLQISLLAVGGALYLWIYRQTIRKEEEFLKEKLAGSNYEEYLKSTPRFFPTFKHFSYPKIVNVHIAGVHKELKNLLAWIGGTLAMILLNWLQSIEILPVLIWSF